MVSRYPNSYIAQNDHSIWISSGDNEEVHVYVQNDRPTPYQVVQVWAAQTNQPGEGSMTNNSVIVSMHSNTTCQAPYSYKPRLSVVAHPAT